MFYRQKINELCYMYNLLLNFSIYVHVSDIQLSKNECVAFAEIGWTLQGLNTLLLIIFGCLSDRVCFRASGSSAQIFFACAAHHRQQSSGQLQQSKYRGAAILNQVSQGKIGNYCVPQYTILSLSQHTRVCSITTVVSPSSVHLLLFFVVDCTSHEAPVCIGGHRSRGGPVSQC